MNTEEVQITETQDDSTEAQEQVELVCDEEECRVHKSFWSVIKLAPWEYPIVAILLGATIALFILQKLHPENNTYIIAYVIVASFTGLWLAFRPSEWAVDGLDNIMRYIGLTAYVAGVISSLASNLPEAVAAGILLVRGSITANTELIHTAFYTTLAAAGFNAILLGIVVLVGSKKKGYIQVKKETMQAEGVLMRWGFVAMLLTFGVSIVAIIDKLFYEISEYNGIGSILGESEIYAELPRIGGMTLVLSYIIYLVYLIIKSKQAKAEEEFRAEHVERATKPTRGKLDEKMPDSYKKSSKQVGEFDTVPADKLTNNEECDDNTPESYTDQFVRGPHMEHPHVSLGGSIALVIIGIIGIAGGGFLMSNAVETTFHHFEGLVDVRIAALIVGFSGAVPEHGIAVVAAAKGKTDVALGNILGGILQMSLLIFGGFSIIVNAPIDDFMLFQLLTIAVVIWFIKRAIADDHKINVFEGIMILVAQTFAFLLLIGELSGITLW